MFVSVEVVSVSLNVDSLLQTLQGAMGVGVGSTALAFVGFAPQLPPPLPTNSRPIVWFLKLQLDNEINKIVHKLFKSLKHMTYKIIIIKNFLDPQKTYYFYIYYFVN